MKSIAKIGALCVWLAAASVVEAETVYTHDVLVLYTTASVTRLGVPTIQAQVESAFVTANQVYANSGVTNLRIKALAYAASPIQESGSSAWSTVVTLANSAATKALRDQVGADIVLLVGEDPGDCGGGQLLWSWNNGTLTSVEAFAVVRSACLQLEFVPTHELGHAQGLNHNREDSGAPNAAGYNYGYRVCTSTGFRDVMSYQCTNGVTLPRIPYFSNPQLTYNGQSLGIDYAADPTHAADAARQLRENAALIANFRSPSLKRPNPPTNITVK